MRHRVTRILHWIANQIGSSGAADELSSRDAHLNPTSAHHTVGWDHGSHLCRTPLSIKVIPSSVLAVHLRFCVRISCCSALEEEEKRNLLAYLYHLILLFLVCIYVYNISFGTWQVLYFVWNLTSRSSCVLLSNLKAFIKYINMFSVL